jgi:hypothetical protein
VGTRRDTARVAIQMVNPPCRRQPDYTKPFARDRCTAFVVSSDCNLVRSSLIRFSRDAIAIYAPALDVGG